MRTLRIERFLAAGPPWLVLAPAFFLGWLPLWYGAPILVGLVVAETWAESIGRRSAA